ncbi:hypothetical protein ACWDVT_24920, partial [Nocardia sp. NPDC003264]
TIPERSLSAEQALISDISTATLSAEIIAAGHDLRLCRRRLRADIRILGHREGTTSRAGGGAEWAKPSFLPKAKTLSRPEPRQRFGLRSTAR